MQGQALMLDLVLPVLKQCLIALFIRNKNTKITRQYSPLVMDNGNVLTILPVQYAPFVCDSTECENDEKMNHNLHR